MAIGRGCGTAIIATAGSLPIDSKYCVSRTWLGALSGRVDAWQQLSWFTGELRAQFAPQHALAMQGVPDDTLMHIGSSRIIRNRARNLTRATLTLPHGTCNDTRSSVDEILKFIRSDLRLLICCLSQSPAELNKLELPMVLSLMPRDESTCMARSLRWTTPVMIWILDLRSNTRISSVSTSGSCSNKRGIAASTSSRHCRANNSDLRLSGTSSFHG